MKDRIAVKSHTLIALMAGYFTFVLNWPFLSRLYGYIFLLEDYSFAFALSVPFFLFSILYIVFSFFAVKGITKAIYIPLLVVSAAVSYASHEYGIIFNTGMIENVMETDSAEAASYLNLASCLYVLVLGVIPAYLIYRTEIIYSPFFKELSLRLASVFCAGLMFGGVTWGFYQDYAAVGRNNEGVHRYIIPTEYVYGSINYVSKNFIVAPPIYKHLAEDAKLMRFSAIQKPTFMVVVLGETARAQNYEYNGYQRATNSFTKPLGLRSLGALESCGTATAVSVPCMFSFLTRDSYKKDVAVNQDNVLDVLAKAGVNVKWVDNNSGCKGVCKRVDTVQIDVSADNDNCDGEYCFDEVMLAYLEDYLSNAGDRDTLVVLHLIGSHGPTYYRRYPEQHRFFMPDCPRSDIQNCTLEQVQNSYDNTIRYTDYVLSKVVEQLEVAADKFDTAMLYMSDHGESLGEKGIYLHGMPYGIAPEEQTHVPALVWASRDYQYDNFWSPNCETQQSKPFNQDYFAHSILGMMDIQTELYNESLDVSAQWHCTEHPIASFRVDKVTGHVLL